MSNYNHPQPQPQPQPQAAYPPPPGTAEPQGGYMAAPPPMKDGEFPPADTQSRGDGFWRGCCAGLCCCCLLDACF